MDYAEDGAETCPSAYAECRPEQRRCIYVPGHRGKLHINRSGFAWDDDEAAGSALRVAEAGRDQAVKLLEEALHLRMNGERAPGGTETWRDWEREAERFLRDRLTREHVDTETARRQAEYERYAYGKPGIRL